MWNADRNIGYNAPKNLQKYATYLDTRIRTYRDLKHDPIRVQSDSNLDRRVETSFDEGRSTSNASRSIQRSKTLAGRKLRSMTVEKGLLRETKAVQRTISSLLDCKVSRCFGTFSVPTDFWPKVVLRQPRRRAERYCVAIARQGLAYTLPGIKRRRYERFGALLRDVPC